LSLTNHKGNSVIMDKLDELLVDECNLARDYHEKRKGKQAAKSEDTGG